MQIFTKSKVLLRHIAKQLLEASYYAGKNSRTISEANELVHKFAYFLQAVWHIFKNNDQFLFEKKTAKNF